MRAIKKQGEYRLYRVENHLELWRGVFGGRNTGFFFCNRKVKSKNYAGLSPRGAGLPNNFLTPIG